MTSSTLHSAWTNASGSELLRYRWHLGCILLKMPAMSLSTGQRKALTLGWQAESLEVAPTPDGEIWAAACVPARAAL